VEEDSLAERATAEREIKEVVAAAEKGGGGVCGRVRGCGGTRDRRRGLKPKGGRCTVAHGRRKGMGFRPCGLSARMKLAFL
jgi:hypothetical protein